MPYPQDLVGRYIAYRVNPGGILLPAHAAQFVNGVLPGQTTAANAAIYTDPPVVGVGPAFVNAGAAWNFTFLNYVAGAVTVVPVGAGVMTGPMSGCYLCTYVENGATHLAHIGTANAPDSDETIQVKAAWLPFTALGTVSHVKGASPFDFFTFTEIQGALIGQATGPNSFPAVCGFFAADGSAWALLLAPVPATRNPPVPLLRVAAAKRMTLQPWSSIAALRKFR